MTSTHLPQGQRDSRHGSTPRPAVDQTPAPARRFAGRGQATAPLSTLPGSAVADFFASAPTPASPSGNDGVGTIAAESDGLIARRQPQVARESWDYFNWPQRPSERRIFNHRGRV